MSTKSTGNSIRQRLANLSVQRKVQYSSLETAFFLERLVARIVATTSLQSTIVFKGGFASLTVYDSPRYTIDLDALLVKSNLEKTLKEVKSAAETDISDGVWFHFESQIDLKTQGEYGGVRQVYRAGLGEKLKNLSKAQVINFDLGVGDPVTPGPRKMKIKSLLSYEELSWIIYRYKKIDTKSCKVIPCMVSFLELWEDSGAVVISLISGSAITRQGMFISSKTAG